MLGVKTSEIGRKKRKWSDARPRKILRKCDAFHEVRQNNRRADDVDSGLYPLLAQSRPDGHRDQITEDNYPQCCKEWTTRLSTGVLVKKWDQPPH
jgi:hypothetical protein